MEKVFYFTISGKLEAESESEATSLIYEILGAKASFQIESLEEAN